MEEKKMKKTTRQYGRGSDMSCASLKEENISPFVRRAVSAPRSNEFVGTQVKTPPRLKKDRPSARDEKTNAKKVRERVSLSLSSACGARVPVITTSPSLRPSSPTGRTSCSFCLCTIRIRSSPSSSESRSSMTSTIVALRSRSSFLLASTPRYTKRERQTRLLSFCLSRRSRSSERARLVGRSCEERESAPARWKGEEKFLKCFSWNERTFELVFFFFQSFRYRTNRTTRGKERKAALFEKEETKTKAGRTFFSSPNDASKRVTNVMIPPISQNTLFLLRLKLSTQTLSPRRSAKNKKRRKRCSSRVVYFNFFFGRNWFVCPHFFFLQLTALGCNRA